MNSLIAVLATAAGVTSSASSTAPLRIDGLVAAVYSPFDSSGALNISVVTAQHNYLASTGVGWVFVSGTTGESVSLTVDERKRLVEAWLKMRPNVIAHVGTDCLADARELAAHAAQAGAKAVAAMPPSFFKPANAEALARTIASICAAAPKLPCYYYHIPSMTGVEIAMIDFVLAIEPLSPNFAGVKYTGLYTHPGFMDAVRVLNYKSGKFEVLCGREEMMLEALAVGIKGHVGSQFNFAGDLFNSIREPFAKEGLTASSSTALRATQLRGIDLISHWSDVGAAHPGVNVGKAFMNLAGVPVGDARLPSLPLDAPVKEAAEAAFRAFCANAADASPPLHMCAH